MKLSPREKRILMMEISSELFISRLRTIEESHGELTFDYSFLAEQSVEATEAFLNALDKRYEDDEKDAGLQHHMLMEQTKNSPPQGQPILVVSNG